MRAASGATRTGSNNKCTPGTTASEGLNKGRCDALAATMSVGRQQK